MAATQWLVVHVGVVRTAGGGSRLLFGDLGDHGRSVLQSEQVFVLRGGSIEAEVRIAGGAEVSIRSARPGVR